MFLTLVLDNVYFCHC